MWCVFPGSQLQINNNTPLKRFSGIIVPGEDTILREGLVFKVEYDGTPITRNEIAAYNALKGIDGIPKFYRAVSFRGHGVLDIVDLGCNLDVFMRSSGGSLPIPTVYTLGRQLVSDNGPSTNVACAD